MGFPLHLPPLHPPLPSDARRELVDQLGNGVVALVKKGGTQDLKKAVRLYKEVVKAVEEEGLVPHLGGGGIGRFWGGC
jgi:hypothetical protein